MSSRDAAEVALDLEADHRLAPEAERQRVGDRDDLHDAGLDEPLHPLADRGLGEPDLLRRASCTGAGRPPGAAR